LQKRISENKKRVFLTFYVHEKSIASGDYRDFSTTLLQKFWPDRNGRETQVSS
jgi:hypothetical protein